MVLVLSLFNIQSDFITEEFSHNGKVFCMTIFWTWDSRRGGKLRVVTLWLHMLGMTATAHKTN
jgi:hypothetical protein